MLKEYIEDVKASLRYYKYNVHSIPGISHLLCRIGRHDYEVLDAGLAYAILECFYCGHKKTSYPDLNRH